tara:strand:- start:6571 stop:9162 length:2592 start_codon:yes stop_codon:yes gene_type:complete
MAESDKIRHEDLVESGLMNPTIENFKELIQVVTLADQQVVKFGVDLNKSLQGIQPSSVANLQQIFTLSNQINEADKSKIATAQILSELRLKEIEQKNQLKVKMAEEAKQEREKIKRAKEQESAYGRLSVKYREAAKLAKDLAAAYGVESKQAKLAAKETLNLNNQLKKIDASIGNHQRNVGNYGKAWGGLNNALGAFGITLGVGAVIQGLKSSIVAFVDAEKNAKNLQFALKNVAGEGEDAFTKLMDQSAKLQASGGIFSDDDIQKSQLQLVNFGLYSDEIETLMPKILDLAAAQGIDLASATDTVIKGLNGQTKGLKAVGLDFKDTGDVIGNYNVLLGKLDKFQGASAASAETMEGKYLVLTNRFDDFKEDIGGFLITEGYEMLQWWDVVIGKATEFDMAMREAQNAIKRQSSAAEDLVRAQIIDPKKTVQEQNAEIKATVQMIQEERKFQQAKFDGSAADSQAHKDSLIRLTQLTEELRIYAKIQNEILHPEAAPCPAGFEKDATGQCVKKKRTFGGGDDDGAGADEKKKLKGRTKEQKRYYDQQNQDKQKAIDKDRKDNADQLALISKHDQHRLDLYNADRDAKIKAAQEADAAIRKIEEERIAKEEKERQQSIEDAGRIADAVSEGLDRRYDLQQEALQREANLIQSEVSVQAELFSRGLENNLASQERILAENTLKQQQLAEQKAKKEEAMQLASMFLELVKEDGDVPKALAQTLVAKGIANAIAGSFAEGVEDFNGKGTGTSDSNIIRFSNGESVVTADGTANNPGLVTAMNEGMVNDYFRDIYLPQFTSSLKNNGESTQRGSNWETAAMINELRELKKIVANKKETTVELSRTGDVIMTTVEQGIRKVINRKPRKF